MATHVTILDNITSTTRRTKMSENMTVALIKINNNKIKKPATEKTEIKKL